MTILATMLFTAGDRPHTSAITYMDVFQAEMLCIHSKGSRKLGLHRCKL